MMGLEPMTSPLPRECSTTELHQPSAKKQPLDIEAVAVANRFVRIHLTRPSPAEYDAYCKKPEQNPGKRPELAWLHCLPDGEGQSGKNCERDCHASAAGWAQIQGCSQQTTQ